MITKEQIIQAVNDYHNIDCRNRCRERRFVYLRFQAVGLILELTHTTKAEIGKMFNYTSASIVNGENVYKMLLEYDKVFFKQVESIKEKINNKDSARHISQRMKELKKSKFNLSTQNYIRLLESSIEELSNALES